MVPLESRRKMGVYCRRSRGSRRTPRNRECFYRPVSDELTPQGGVVSRILRTGVRWVQAPRLVGQIETTAPLHDGPTNPARWLRSQSHRDRHRTRIPAPPPGAGLYPHSLPANIAPFGRSPPTSTVLLAPLGGARGLSQADGRDRRERNTLCGSLRKVGYGPCSRPRRGPRPAFLRALGHVI